MSALVCCAAFAQLPSRLEGKINLTGSADSLWVELFEHPGHTFAGRFPVSRDGSFTVNADQNQHYIVHVVSSRGDRIASDHVQFRMGHPAEIRMPVSATAAPPPSGPISLTRLAHKPSKPARRRMRDAESRAAAGDIAGSASILEQLLEADPNWFEAWNNLGARRIQLGRYADALTAFQRAAAIDGDNATLHTNIGLTQLFLRQPAEAEVSAGRALRLEPAAPRARYVGALAMLQQNKQTGVALQSLRESAVAVPLALLAVAEWHCRHDAFAACKSNLEDFLRTKPGPNHATAQKWLAQLNAR